MNNTFKMLLAAGAFVAVQQSQALTWRDMESHLGTILSAGPGGTASASGQFDITAGNDSITITPPVYTDAGNTYNDITGFQPGTDVATGAKVNFWFRDDLDNTTEAERVSVTLDLANFLNNELVKTEGFSIFGGQADILASLNADGKVDYQVTAIEGDFVFDYARLDVDGIDNQIPSVPDGGATAMLLGLGTLGVAAMRRKLS
jgi:hypothetical protein